MKKILKLIALTLVATMLLTGIPVVALGNSSAPEMSIDYCNLSFRENVCIKYAVASNSTGKTTVLIWHEPSDEYLYGTHTAELETVGNQVIGGETYKIFDYTKLSAKQMTDVVYARAYTVVDGEEYYSEVTKYSVLQYAYNKLGKTATASTDTELKEMLTNMLLYGTSSQKHFDYKEDRFATAEWYQVKLTVGLLDDGCAHGLYRPGDTIILTAPETDAQGHKFYRWVDSNVNEIATTVTYELTVGTENEIYTPIYEHEHSEVIDAAVAPSCKDTGLSEGSHCSICGEVIVAQEVIEATGEHNFGKWVTVKEATTSKEGLMERVCGCGEKETQIIEKITPTGELAYVLNEDKQSYSVKGIGTWTDPWLDIPETYNELPVTSISEEAFRNSNLETIIIPDSVTSIGNLAFIYCTSLKQLKIGSGVTSIGMNLFEGSDSVKNIVVSDENPVYDSRNYCNAIIKTSNNTLVIGCGNTRIPDTVETIGNAAFAWCHALISIEIPKSVTHIDFQAFSNCINLTTVYYTGSKNQWNEIYIDNSFGINQYLIDAILICTGADDLIYESFGNGQASVVGFAPTITIPNETSDGEVITTIASYAFESLQKLIIKIPLTIQEFGVNAFVDCDTIEIHYSGTLNEWENIYKYYWYDNRCSNITVICSDGTLQY